jgi:AcrR family transcriptional regulator
MRLQEAAMDLFRKRGYENTTVAEIAESAGLTERTFFRHFEDKREVLFAGSDSLRELLANAVAAAPRSATPMAAVTLGIEAAAGVFNDERRTYARQRHAIIAANDELRERELIKLASLAAAIAGALRRRGVPDPAAGLAAEAGIGVFRVTFERWVDQKEARAWPALVRESVGQLRRLISASA